ncbi:MAG: UvrD-helicase domain-containing protein [Syntrophobacterales bacterium]|nr:MAG: UvrD-helicase domain-containing protein [Syntrophobacterales bacterium]
MGRELLKDLNPVQREAVVKTEGPLLIFAGAGSGKTRVLTYRIAYLILEKGIAPERILAVTFTNKAAGEMKERVDCLLAGASQGVWMSTFHSACARILRKYVDRLGFNRNFVIYDEKDQEHAIKTCMKDLEIDQLTFHPRAIQAEINRAKNHGLFQEDFTPDPFNVLQKRVALVYQAYQELLRRNNALDFGDLLLLVDKLFREFPEILEHYQDRLLYVSVDEFQDTNFIQYRFIRDLVRKKENICVVGDDDQSIYRWRGAEITNILNFERDFPGTTVITLEQNYRSTKRILEAAWQVVRRNRERREKILWTENVQGEPIVYFTGRDEQEEAGFIIQEIQNHPERKYSDFAAFYRTNAQSRAIEEELVKARIPYAVVAGLRFYERKEVKDVIAYLRVIANSSDDMSLKRIIQSPPRGIGPKTVQRLEGWAKERGITLYEAFREAGGDLSEGMRKKVGEFIDLMETLREAEKTHSPRDLILLVLARTGYLDWLGHEPTGEAISRRENVEELVNVVAQFEQDPANEDKTLAGFLDRVSLISDVDDYDDKSNRVALMTLHCAKGLEFPVVFLVGMEDGLFPHHRRGEGAEDLEEERRLCYVGMTRAKEKLYLTNAERRRVFGSERYNYPSRFIEEIPQELMIRMAGDGVMAFHGEEPVDGAPYLDYSSSQISEVSTQLEESQGEDLEAGVWVKHPKFGPGVVKSREGRGEELKVWVYFPSVGTKKLKAKHAGLEVMRS